jgi:hypothetical protein
MQVLELDVDCVQSNKLGLQHRETSMRRDVKFSSEGADLSGWVYVPDSKPPWPLVVMAHGFSATRHMTADKYAEVFHAAGLAVLLYDHRGFGDSPRAWALIDEIRLTVQDMNPDTEAEQVLYLQGLERVHDLADTRRDRLVEVREGIPAMLWVVLVAGAIVTIGFTYLFGLDDTTTHTLMVALLALVIGLVLFTIGSLEYPFAGAVRLGPDAFELVLERFASSKLSVL